MNLEKALKILGLKTNFTEEEVKNAHRILAKEYHPDFHEKSKDRNIIENKMKDINEARDYVIKYLKSGKKNYHQNNNSYHNDYYSETYQTTKINELRNIIKLDKNKLNISEKEKIIIQEINKIFQNFCASTNYKNDLYIDKLFQKSYIEIKEKFKELKTKFYEENVIFEFEVLENLNYECTLKEFYEQLITIQQKYSKKIIIKNKLEQEASKYKIYAGYEEIKEHIEKHVNNTLSKIANNGYRYTKKDIDDMNQKISDHFQKYYLLKKKINELKELVDKVDDENIKNKYKLLETKFYSGTQYSLIEDYIPTLEKMIYKYHQQNINKEELINIIYNSLIIRYNKVIKNNNINTTYSNINKINEFFSETLKIFKKVCENNPNLDYLNLFNEITFKYADNDTKILNTITKKIESEHKKIYINKKDNYSNEKDFFYLNETEMKIYKIDGENIFSMQITLEELQKNYISLDEILDKSTYIGRDTTNLPNDQLFIIYLSNEYIIYKNNEKDEQIRISSISKKLDHIFYSMYKNNKYQDKEYLYTLIKNQLERKIEIIKEIEERIKNSNNTIKKDFQNQPFISLDELYYNKEENNRGRR